ncbi:MAG TPA: folylpolyglutamate synthase/dihydrofolate synthase family protein, partial [Bacteroidales bacterium]
LFSRLPMFQRIGQAAYKADLEVTIQLLDLLGKPQEKFKAIHVAGTNGKGSVSHLIASILQEGGYKTGLYTSPHLKDFRERIKINGEMIGEEKVTGFVEKYGSSFEKLNPSFFEMTVGMAYDHFANEQVDFAVLETGMGGRLDSTNVCLPVITVITNIGHDHIQFLGDTLEKITFEKAGIIKEKIPVVIGKKQPETIAVFERVASEKKAPIFFAEDYISFREISSNSVKTRNYDVWLENKLYFENITSPLSGIYQSENLANALQAIQVIKSFSIAEITKKDIQEGIESVVNNTGINGRWQVLSTNPLTICDTGHNPEGINQVVEQIKQTNHDKLRFVFGMVGDKNPESVLNLLPKNAVYYFCKPDIPRGMEVDVLYEHAQKFGLEGKKYHSVTQAYNSAVNDAGTNDLVFIGGSTFVVAEVV